MHKSLEVKDFLVKAESRGVSPYCKEACIQIWPLHDIANANTVWCTAYTRGVVGRGCIRRNSRAMVLQ